jgi:ZIP family zinc transporter
MTGICTNIISLPCALFWGAIAVSGIIIGALIGIFAPLTHRAIAATMAVAAGLLLAAATVELAAEAITVTPSLAGGFAALMIGAIGFSWVNSILSSVGAGDRKRCGECVAQPSETSNPGSGNAIALGTAMDAIPEALVLGLTLKTHGLEAALIAAIALGNLPEAISGSAGMKDAGRSVKWILGVWGTVAVSTVVLTGAGFWVAGNLSQSLTAALQLFGAGALIAMVTETIIPEAVHGTPKFAGTIAAAGFAALLLFGVLAG